MKHCLLKSWKQSGKNHLISTAAFTRVSWQEAGIYLTINTELTSEGTLKNFFRFSNEKHI